MDREFLCKVLSREALSRWQEEATSGTIVVKYEGLYFYWGRFYYIKHLSLGYIDIHMFLFGAVFSRGSFLSELTVHHQSCYKNQGSPVDLFLALLVVKQVTMPLSVNMLLSCVAYGQKHWSLNFSIHLWEVPRSPCLCPSISTPELLIKK